MRPQPHRPGDSSRPVPAAAAPNETTAHRTPVPTAVDEVPELPGGRRPTPGAQPAPQLTARDLATAQVPLAKVATTFFDRPVDEEDDDEREGLRTRMHGALARIRSNPRTVRGGSLGVIGAGVALFVAASVATPLASAETKDPNAAAKRQQRAVAARIAAAESSTSAVLPALRRAPIHVAKQAAVDHGTISGLAANGIPKVALNAYRVAAARMSHVDPGCGIDWALLAGIGRVESNHGRFAGAKLHADGTSSPRIIGPALDGEHYELIPAPGNGTALAGDATFAHALGPMQFIPSTWAAYGTDANGDGKTDIFNINDAALAAARYLCTAGGNLRTHAGQTKAVLAYNHSDEYLAQVLALADAYRRGVPVTGIPVGNTTGALPTVVDTGYVPPVNPGAPTAVDKKAKAAAKKAAAEKAAKKKAADKKAAGKSGGGKKGGQPAKTSSANLEPGSGPTKAPSSSSPSKPTGSSAGGSSSTPPSSGSSTPTNDPSTDSSSSSAANSQPCIPIPLINSCP